MATAATVRRVAAATGDDGGGLTRGFGSGFGSGFGFGFVRPCGAEFGLSSWWRGPA